VALRPLLPAEATKRMKGIGSVDIPQKAFMAVLDTGEERK